MDIRPDPDALLRAVSKQEENRTRGKLRVFFGMAAGVGKTYAMLRTAQQRRREGVNIVVGVVETHGRPETAHLLEGLPQIPKKRISYRDTDLEEMDLDAILERKPEVVLVDELAHTNAPGSRHPKRWQDVLELLDHGIDVYTTLNVQHLESRKEVVEKIAGSPIRETVSDSILEQASQIELIDITPKELLARLREGKVYLPPQAELAERHFFQEDRLTALREIALRFTTQKVDQELSDLRSVHDEPKAWRPVERLLVAISHSPYSEQVIRAAKNRAFELDAPWIALYVATGQNLHEEDRKQLQMNLSLARELGAEVVTVSDANLSMAIRRIAQQKAATQIILGRPTRRWIRDTLWGGTLLERLVREETDLDVHVIRQDRKGREKSRRRVPRPSLEARIEDYAVTFWIITAATGISVLLKDLVGYRAVGFIFLLSVLGVSLFKSLGPIFFASVLASTAWNFFFIPPFGTFYISSLDDLIMFAMFFLTASVTGFLTHRIRQREWLLRKQTERMEVLYEFLREIARSGKLELYIPAISDRLGLFLNGSIVFFLSGSDHQFQIFGSADPRLGSEKELAVARWSLANNQAAGWSTDTLSGSIALYLPMRSATRTVGVLAYLPKRRTALLIEEMNLLRSAADQIAMSVEKEELERLANETERLQISERLHEATLSSLSHELRTPLTTIVGAASALRQPDTFENEKLRVRLLDDLFQSTQRMNRLVEDLLDMSRLQSGHMALKLDWHDPSEIVLFSLQSLSTELAKHQVFRNLASNIQMIRVDFHLFDQALRNLILNAARYSPAGSGISVTTEVASQKLCISIADEGPGIPADQRDRVFEKFYRLPGSPQGGTGLGLSIAKAIIEAHHGEISIESNSPRGSVFRIELPLPEPPGPPPMERSL